MNEKFIHTFLSTLQQFAKARGIRLVYSYEELFEHQLRLWHSLYASQYPTTFTSFYEQTENYLSEYASGGRIEISYLAEPFVEGDSILDFGCGIGIHGLYFASLGYQVTFVDVDSVQSDFVKFFLSQQNITAEFLHPSELDMIAPHFFDNIFCLDVLEHIQDWRALLEHFKKIVSPRGKLFLIVSFRIIGGGNYIHIHNQNGLSRKAYEGELHRLGFHRIFSRIKPSWASYLDQEPLEIYTLEVQTSIKFQELAHKLNYSTSFSELNHAIASHAGDIEAIYNRGLINFEQGNKIDAERDLTSIVKLLPSYDPALRLLAIMCIEDEDDAKAWQYVENIFSHNYGNKHFSLAVLKIWIKRNGIPDLKKKCHPLLIRNVITTLAAMKMSKQALQLFLGLLKPEDYLLSELYQRELGRLYRSIGDHRAALMCFNQMGVDSEWHFYEIASLHMANNEWQKALNLLEREQERYPYKPSSWLAKSKIYRRVGRYEEALFAVNQAQNLEPGLEWCWFNIGLIQMDAGNFTNAVKAFEQEDKLYPGKAETYLQFGIVHRMEGRINQATMEFEKARNIDMYLEWLNFNIGLTLREKGELDEALSRFQEEEKLYPGKAVTKLQIGIVHRLAGSLEKADEFFEIANDISPNLPWYNFEKALILWNKGKYDTALSYLKEEIGVNPYNLTAYLKTIEWCSQIQFNDQVEEALVLFEKNFEILKKLLNNEKEHQHICEQIARLALVSRNFSMARNYIKLGLDISKINFSSI